MITCGVFLIDKYDRLLVVHPTGAPLEKWGIPKGINDIGETDWFTAKRELKEETGIDLNGLPIKFYNYMGFEEYKYKKKTLKGFYVKIDMNLPARHLLCTSMFTSSKGIRLPEIDNIQWVYIDIAKQVIQDEQRELLIRYTQ